MNEVVDFEVLKTIAITWSLKIIYALVFAIILVKLSGWLEKRLRKAFVKSQVDQAVANFLSRMAYYLMLAAGVVSMLGIFGIQTTSFAAILASMGFAVGMALQGTLGHFASGILLLVFRPFKLDDVVTVAGHTGKVVNIDLLNTVINTADNRKIIVPNGSVFGSAIVVNTAYDTRRVDILVGCSYDAGIDETRATLEKVAKSVEGGLSDPEAVVYLSDLGASSVDWAVRVWTNTPDYWAVRERLVREIKKELDSAKIGIPYPHMELVLPKGVVN